VLGRNDDSTAPDQGATARQQYDPSACGEQMMPGLFGSHGWPAWLALHFLIPWPQLPLARAAAGSTLTSPAGAGAAAQEIRAWSTFGEVRAARRRLPAAQQRTIKAIGPILILMTVPPVKVR
jgi:hypothetical protein